MCWSTVTVTRKDSLNLPYQVQVPCGSCPSCLKKRCKQWAFRLNQEAKESLSACFLTLTYEVCPFTKNGLPTLSKRHFQLFMKKLRKRVPQDLPKLKYYACGEYGTETHRPHYHMILFNLPHPMINTEVLSKIWNHGFVDVDPRPPGEGSMHYVSKYIMKRSYQSPDLLDLETGELVKDDRLKEFSLMSKKLGISYLTKAMKKYHIERLEMFVTRPGGDKMALPRYFKDKLELSEDQLKMIRDAQIEAEQVHFEKFFKGSNTFKKQWIEDQFRKERKKFKLERLKL